MNAHAREALAPLYPAPIEYQASVVLQHALADNEADFVRRRAELVNEATERANAIHADYMALPAAGFVTKYGARA
jgi:hypothetical protein